ncbi:MAG: TolC family protein [Saprospiraceae bacterium]|nr:TolC family protein [Saprospiraceae bacterium]
MYKRLIILGLVMSAYQMSAQEVWSLEKCILTAQENNRTIKQSQIAVKNTQLTNKQDRYSQYPTVNASSNLGFNFGRSVNPATYQFENINTRYNGINLSAGVMLYNGGRIQNQIKQSSIDIQAAQADLEQTAQNISLQVAQAFLQILLNEEQLSNAKKRAQTTLSQLDRVERQIKVGSLAPNARYDLAAQAARDEQSIVTAANNVELSYLTLKNLLELAPDKDMKIEAPSVVVPSDVNPDAYSFKMIYNQALGNQPQIRAGESRIKSAEVGVKIAEAALLPSLSMNANLNTNFSSTIKDFTKATKTNVPYTLSGNATIGGQTVPVSFTTNQEVLTDAPKKPYFSQIGDNFGQGLGLNLQIPIWDGYQRRTTIERQQLNVDNQVIALERTKQQLKSDVQNAIASSRAARKQYEAAQKTFDAQKAAFDATEKRFQIGAANGFEFTQARNQLDTAERDVVVAKYDYLFRLKIVEFYEGKKLTLK